MRITLRMSVLLSAAGIAFFVWVAVTAHDPAVRIACGIVSLVYGASAALAIRKGALARG